MHFSKDSFTQDPLRLAELGVHGKFQARLKPDAVPSIPLTVSREVKDGRCQELSKSVGKLRLVNLCIYNSRFQCNLYLYMCNQLVIILTVNILYENFLVLPGFDFCKKSRTVTLARMHTGSYSGHITDRKKNKLEKRQLLILSKLITHLK